MAYTKGSLLIRIDGTLTASSVQTWSVGLRYQLGETVTQGNLNDIATALASQLPSKILDVAAGIWSSDIKLTQVSVYYYPSLPGTAQLAAAKPMALGTNIGATRSLPTYVSCCVSTLTALPTRSGRGRVYWPAGVGLDATGQFSQTAVDAAANGTKEVIDVINSSVRGVLPNQFLEDVSVISQAKDHAESITSVRADSLPDVQHRRQDQLAASYKKSVAIA